MWNEKKEALELTHYLKADGVEAEFLTGESDLISAAKILKSLGPKEIIITHKTLSPLSILNIIYRFLTADLN